MIIFVIFPQKWQFRLKNEKFQISRNSDQTEWPGESLRATIFGNVRQNIELRILKFSHWQVQNLNFKLLRWVYDYYFIFYLYLHTMETRWYFNMQVVSFVAVYFNFVCIAVVDPIQKWFWVHSDGQSRPLRPLCDRIREGSSGPWVQGTFDKNGKLLKIQMSLKFK